ncbi:MAG: hypothetical protein K9M98_11610 [Cephaloticoccus sp.]|nr:hypothetical protein [Cephaloticoccus sp.]MCF7761138.1 hypothetical protein [Cephaloticoccus sp.]
MRQTTDGVEFALEAVIVYDGAGSWRRHAYWDEYYIRLVNRTSEPLRVETFILGDVFDRTMVPGTDPWVLEKAGRNHEKFLKSKGLPADAYACVYPNRNTVVNAAGGATLAFMVAGPAGASTGVAFLAVGVGSLYVPVWVANKAFIDPKHRKIIATEFGRRNLKLPMTVPPGATLRGSLFYPLTPGPERLQAKGQLGNKSWSLTLDLPDLAGVHFTYVPDKAAAIHAMKAPRKPLEKVPERGNLQ